MALVAGQRRKRYKQMEIEQRRQKEKQEQQAFMDSLRQSSVVSTGRGIHSYTLIYSHFHSYMPSHILILSVYGEFTIVINDFHR